MGQRISRKGKKKNRERRRSERSGRTILSAPVAQSGLQNSQVKDVTFEQKNDTIKALDFFGFSPRFFWRDLQQTALASGVVLVVLGAIYWWA